MPTNTLELVEAVVARRAARAGTIEQRAAPDKPLEVLVQHLVTVALGGAFAAAAMFDEVRSAYAYRALTQDEFQRALDFVEKGGSSLTVYPEYHRVCAVEGLYCGPDRATARPHDRTTARRHRMQIGTIVSESSIVVAHLSSTELARRRFREIARVAGLVFTGYPGQPKSARQLQASSSLFFDVFSKYDATNLLLTQTQTEVLGQELDIRRLAASLERMCGQPIGFVDLKVPSPFALPLMVERFRERLSTEKLKDRLERMLKDMERTAAAAARHLNRRCPGPTPHTSDKVARAVVNLCPTESPLP